MRLSSGGSSKNVMYEAGCIIPRFSVANITLRLGWKSQSL